MPPTLDELAEQARHCQACPLWRNATQTVFGEGSPTARAMVIGEQPGDAEDLAGRPFVGPAGRVLDRALADAGLERAQLYVTNAVKHFKWTLRGRRRLHKTPAQGEIDACRRWLDAEMAALSPQLLICLGATATHALLGGSQTVTSLRGRLIRREGAPPLLATVHPSYVLRVPSELQAQVFRGMVDDLKVAAEYLAAGKG